MLPSFLKKRNADWKAKKVLPYLSSLETVLDFGCGDLALAQSLKMMNPKLSVEGVDVIDFPNRPKDIKFYTYNGETLPFKDRSFDTVLSYYVFHHCKNPKKALSECARVARSRIIVVEAIPQHRIEIPFMKLLDGLFNVIKMEGIALPYNFYPLSIWRKIAMDHDLTMSILQKPNFDLLSILPIGKMYIFELKKKKLTK